MIAKVYSKEEIINSLEGVDLINPIEIGFVEYSKGNSVVPPVGELLFDRIDKLQSTNRLS